MARSKLPLLIALTFFALAGYMLLTAPDDEFNETLDLTKEKHPCPYADILGLDENSVNPHVGQQ
jgi:hypothetical protein